MHPATELKNLCVRAPRLTLAVAESVTCGLVQARIGAVAGASEYFLGGVTAYSLEQKVKLLGVDRAHAKKVNCVSREVAEQMARGACALFGSDLAVATTGYAEPFDFAQGGPFGSAEGGLAPAKGIEQPFAWWALCHRRRGRSPRLGSGQPVLRTGCVQFAGAKRTQMQAAVADAVLLELVDYLREWRG